MPRVFVGVRLAAALESQARQLQDALAGALTPASWVAPENLHATLRFLGDIDEAQLERATAAAREVARRLQPFGLTLEALGTFPSRGAPRVLWVGVADGVQVLTTCAEALNTQLDTAGLPGDGRPFRPHVTLARLKHQNVRCRQRRRWTTSVREAIDAAAWPATPAKVRALSVVESRLREAGPTYIERATLELGIGG